MKKILLLIVSGLLIACMAGSAMAGSEIDVSDPSVEINTETLVPTTVDVTITAYDDNNPSSTQYYAVGLDADPGLEVYMISTAPLGDLDVSPNVYVTSEVSDVFESYSMTQEHKGTLYIRGTTGGDVTISVYKGYISEDNFVIGKTVSVASVTATPIPEFPTIALPVAAVLGLIFIFGRKKEGL